MLPEQDLEDLLRNGNAIHGGGHHLHPAQPSGNVNVLSNCGKVGAAQEAGGCWGGCASGASAGEPSQACDISQCPHCLSGKELLPSWVSIACNMSSFPGGC